MVTVHDAHDRDGALVFGLQSSSGELDAGTATDGGGVRYECRARTRPRPDGTVSCTGEYLHGPARERFLYISFRTPGGDAWIRRTKVLLPPAVDAGTRRLSARVVDEGRSRVRFDQDWVAEPGD